MTDLTAFVDDIVHEPIQTEGRGLDLTVTEVYEVASPGRVDFGGGELETADLEPHDRQYRDEDDDYQWWHLDEGQYLIEYNESLALPDDLRATVQTRDELLPAARSTRRSEWVNSTASHCRSAAPGSD